ncbi:MULTISPECIES: FxsA family protein [Paenibacillus]|uniref:Membrane protein FxsA n=1 Tax=Paenibacillus azoreducens TaxID=116718 RepID=A0A919YB76_9BACL|nr:MULTISPECIES: FxsA family protein [Paenibacillus]MBE9912454.1 FxsA family protein [Paenibacillus donghaensis]GIO45800.1 membrane protein FxsA [Paenibacillus azoreducens]
MWKWLIAVMIIVPVVEIYGFNVVASRVGGGNTFLLTIATSAIGMVMMRFEGRKVLEDSRARMNSGQIPGRSLVDGLCIFIGGILLVIPGFVTDIIGFTMVFPLSRPLYRYFILKWLERKMKKGQFTIYRR